MGNPFCYIELNSDDPEKAKEFYKELFDWEYEDYPMGDIPYTVIKTGKEPGGGIFKNPVPEQAPSHWLIYIQVDDVDAYTEKVKKLGGIVHKEPTEVPNMGKFSVIEDPAGAVSALWQTYEK